MTTGATQPRDLTIPGRSLSGIHFAMEFLTANTKSLLASNLADGRYISAKDKRVVVIGGGDTGADCIGTALRHGCKSLMNLELLDQSPAKRAADNPWPLWPKIHRSDYAHEEAAARFGADPRNYAVVSKEFAGPRRQGRRDPHQPRRMAASGRRAEDGRRRGLVRAARGRSRAARDGLSRAPRRISRTRSELELDARSNYRAAHGKFATSVSGVFAAGDCRRGQSLVVWAINEGRGAARAVDEFLTGVSQLPAPKLSLGGATA